MVSNVTAMMISWNSSTFGRCHFNFRVTINAINSEVRKSVETYETFAVFFDLQPRDYIISVTTRADSCASNPVSKSFTLSVNMLRGSKP